MSDATEDTISPRGLRYTPPVTDEGDATLRVYESSDASGPHVWIAAGLPDTTKVHLHLTVEQAREHAENVLRVCDLHYQMRGWS